MKKGDFTLRFACTAPKRWSKYTTPQSLFFFKWVFLCFKNCSGKITKEEMVETLSDLGKIKPIFDEKGKIIIPDEIENLFR